MGVTSNNGTTAQTVMGRPRVTSRATLEARAFELFARKGFEETTVDDIAAAAGIGRRTFFRYCASKNDLVWGDFEGHLLKLRRLLEEADPTLPTMEVLRRAVVEFNRFDPRDVPWHRQRMELILKVPTLQADATLRYASWRAVIAEFVASRTGLPPSAMTPRLAGHVLLAAAVAAYEHWLSGDGDAELAELLDKAIRRVSAGLSAALQAPGG
ncbi:mycofactocin system transcriptional regulator [Thermomonospora curvata]|uniref:Transcriptional regulator, TetR family n=1 Tax=Thermomonospora curvata (strain ATCC 19995 / DSM 43183 / JCM 3096 / KCTC 9072 / NBRC 15933 / NCIMB 10081 / Henssen B9) TaxID=471852 RepID=D1A2Y3_THECD|nr:transcriptional regulator, TetR family [Thermomonospora curvata DSM 43183]